MAEDTRSYIDQTLARAEAYSGKELTPDEMATEFAKFELVDRMYALDQINMDLANSELSIREASKMLEYTHAMKNTHEALRKAGR
jgi:hypothetical protein